MLEIEICEPGKRARVVNVNRPKSTIGRSSRSDIRMTSDVVSSRHASVCVYSDGCVIEDLGSSNGTFINGRRINGPISCPDGTIVQLGENGPSIKILSGSSPAVSPPLEPVQEARSSDSPITTWLPWIAGGTGILLFGTFALCVVTVVCLGAFFIGTRAVGSGGELNAREVFEAYGESTYLVFFRLEGSPGVNPVGTCFIVDKRGLFGTNGHVVAEIAKLKSLSDKLTVHVASPGGNYEFPVVDGMAHRNYEDNPDGGPDVGILRVEIGSGVRLKPLPIANDSDLSKLNAGTELCYIGYPVFYDGVDYNQLNKIIPRLSEGNIVRMMNLHREASDAENARLLEHDMLSWGGASGSPIFSDCGKVVALHFAGLPVYDEATKQYKKQQASIKRGIRADALREVLDRYRKKLRG